MDTVIVTVVERPSIKLSAVEDTGFCPGDTVNLFVEGSSGFPVSWYLDGVLIDSTTDTTYTATTGGSYEAQTWGISNGECRILSNEVVLVEISIPETPVIILSGDTMFVEILNDTSAFTFQWYYEDSLLAGATDFFLLPDKEGEYFVEVFDSFGYSSGLSEGFIFLIDGVSDVPIDTETSSVQVYPNPVRDVLQVAGCKSPVLLTVFDVFGKVVLSEVVSSQDSGVSVSLLESGVYYWVVEPMKRVPSASLGMTSRIGGKVLVLR